MTFSFLLPADVFDALLEEERSLSDLQAMDARRMRFFDGEGYPIARRRGQLAWVEREIPPAPSQLVWTPPASEGEVVDWSPQVEAILLGRNPFFMGDLPPRIESELERHQIARPLFAQAEGDWSRIYGTVFRGSLVFELAVGTIFAYLPGAERTEGVRSRVEISLHLQQGEPEALSEWAERFRKESVQDESFLHPYIEAMRALREADLL